MAADSSVRKWAGCFLGAAVALQFYFVQELLAASALFAIGFAAVALVVLGLYGLQKGWEMAVTRIFSFDQMAARGLQTRDRRVNGQAVASLKLPQVLINEKQKLERWPQPGRRGLGSPTKVPRKTLNSSPVESGCSEESGNGNVDDTDGAGLGSAPHQHDAHVAFRCRSPSLPTTPDFR